ncbi:MAG: glycosyltransferase family 2 protein [Sedimentisphaerales bacterium]|nr:glycosyltransferase family 2 protein [Sedimentisphaerales bacterium]
MQSELIPFSIRCIAVLLTCHNRKNKTMACLHALYVQVLPAEVGLSVYLVDDGSSDGTAEAVAGQFPDVRILQGNGNLYWCGGMRWAWEEAAKSNYDAYLWLNDDIELLPDALFAILNTWFNQYKETQKSSIIVGACRDPRSNQLVYGGYGWDVSKGNLPESNHPQRCYTMNGNIVFVPRDVACTVGNLSSDYTHAMGDIDYGLRASKMGFAIYIAPGILGLCAANSPTKWVSSAVPFIERWKNLHSPKGLPPWEYARLRRQCGVRFWFLVPFKVYLRVFFPWFWGGRGTRK